MLSFHLSCWAWINRDRIKLISFSSSHIRADWLHRRINVLLKRLTSLILRILVHKPWMNLLLVSESLPWGLLMNFWWRVSNVLVLLNRISMIDISCPWILPCSRVESASRIRSRSCSWSSSRASSWPCSWIRSIALPRSLLRFSVQCWHWLKLVLLLLSLRLELLFLVSIWNLVV